MNRKTIAILAELIPILSAAAAYLLIVSKYHSEFVQGVISVAMLLAFGGFGFFLLGRRLAREDRIVGILGVLDMLTTVCVVLFYVLAIFSFGL